MKSIEFELFHAKCEKFGMQLGSDGNFSTENVSAERNVLWIQNPMRQLKA
jgi:hypothetical protein